jgi:hypothetical protein
MPHLLTCQGAPGARKLESDKHFNDALALYKQARRLWPNEPQIKKLADLFIL